MDQSKPLNEIALLLRQGRSFLLTTHEDPDADAIGSVLALGIALENAKKDVVLFTDKPLEKPFSLLSGAGRIVSHFDPTRKFDGVLILDCAGVTRIGGYETYIQGHNPIINIDHHETNDFFGDLNLVDPARSSTGELVYDLITEAGLPVCHDVAGGIFAAVQTDTGSFRYENTTQKSFEIAAKMMGYGVRPWEISRKMMDEHSLARLKLLQLALLTIELLHRGKIGVMTITSEMFREAQADRVDCERFVDYPRFVHGVEIAVLIRQTGENGYKFSLRSNGKVNAAHLASRFEGGGHRGAAGFERHGCISILKKEFLKEAIRFLDGTSG